MDFFIMEYVLLTHGYLCTCQEQGYFILVKKKNQPLKLATLHAVQDKVAPWCAFIETVNGHSAKLLQVAVLAGTMPHTNTAPGMSNTWHQQRQLSLPDVCPVSGAL